MSRVGKLPIELPKGVSVKQEKNKLTVIGPKGELSRELPRVLQVKIAESGVSVSTKKETKLVRSMHGTYRAHIANMIHGVTQGWSKTLELVGTGYRATLTGNNLVLTVGFSHPVEVIAPEGITFKVEKTLITIEGTNKEEVGQIAAKIRMIRPPEPYKGKGIRYQDEIVRRKPGKAAKAAGAPA